MTESLYFDALIIGGGAAGCFLAASSFLSSYSPISSPRWVEEARSPRLVGLPSECARAGASVCTVAWVSGAHWPWRGGCAREKGLTRILSGIGGAHSDGNADDDGNTCSVSGKSSTGVKPSP